jgi:uncharacterized repeat protein (TIGR03803 family)
MKHRGNVLSLVELTMIAVTMLVAAVAANAQTFTELHTYPIGSGAWSGIRAPQGMAQGRDGDLYSTIANNGTGTAVDGTVYKITTTGALSEVYSFCALTACDDGDDPEGGVTLGLDGNLYGTTKVGGKDGAGTIFKVTPTGTLTTLHSFTNSTDDSVPIYRVVLGQDGNFYGVSEAEYNGQYGAFFRISPSGVFKALGDFDYTNGSLPNLPTQGTDLNFYGTAQQGGDNGTNCGVVYKVTTGGKITVLHNFAGYPTDGCRPISVLVQGTDGDFYGTTYSGGDSSADGNGNGTIFKISPSGVYTLLHSFTYGVSGSTNLYDAQLPEAGLTLGTEGNFYGVGAYGGMTNYGAIFKITPAGTESVLYSFCYKTCTSFSPATPLVLHTNGDFYGNSNGNSLGGAVFYSLNVGFKPIIDLVTWTGKVGATVQILGQGFTGATGVSFNGTAAKFVNVSDTYMTATVPAGATTGSVTVTTFTSTLKANHSFLVTPQIKSFTPTSGIVGTSVTITGVSLTQATAVTIGGKAATFKVNSDTSVTATVPPGARTGAAISIKTAGGSASFGKFVVIPEVTSFTPTSGVVGTSVTITGNSFTAATKVTFGGVDATSYKVINDTQVDALVPTGAVTGPIAVTTAGGTGTSATNFTVAQ